MSWKNINTFLKEAYGHKTFRTEKFEEWSHEKNIKTWSTGRMYNVPQYLKTGRSTVGFPNHTPKIPPHIDHAVFFKSTNPLKVWLVYHPYRQVDEIIDEIELWANENDLIAEVLPSNFSWYHNDTSMVVITIR